MNISWGALEMMALGRRPIPPGCTLDYEFRPSLYWYPDIHAAHAVWKAAHPKRPEGEYWHLDAKEHRVWEDKWREAKYKVFKKRHHQDCCWQRFTLTSHNNGNQIILQMDSRGYVSQLREVEQTVTMKVLVAA